MRPRPCILCFTQNGRFNLSSPLLLQHPIKSSMRMTPQLASSACNLVAVACDGWSNNASKVKLTSVTLEWAEGAKVQQQQWYQRYARTSSRQDHTVKLLILDELRWGSRSLAPKIGGHVAPAVLMFPLKTTTFSTILNFPGVYDNRNKIGWHP